MSRKLCCILTLWRLLPSLHAFPSFRYRAPNGHRVPCPTGASGCSQGDSLKGEPDSVCYGLGHQTCQGGTLPLNAWGEAWRRAGEWTEGLCKADSDNDGQSNGEELGDPCCLWKEGDEPSPYMAAFTPSHPGLASSKQPESYTRPCCNGVDTNVEPSVSIVKKAVFNPGEEQMSLEWRIKNFTIPGRKTVYTDFYFNFPGGNAPFFLVAGYAIVDKPLVLHHYTFEACSDPIPESSVGVPVSMFRGVPGVKCGMNLGGFSGWAPGVRELFNFDKYTALPVGRAAGIASVKVNVHYTDGHKYPGTVTQDGIRLLYTRTPRKHVQLSTPIMQIGRNPSMFVPARKRRFFVTRTCTIKDICKANDQTCRRFSKSEPLKVRASFYHAHLLGTEMYQMLYRQKDGCITDLASQPIWYFDDQASFPLESKQLTLAPGDVVQSTCVYNSMSRSKDTVMGPSTYDEMCFANILTEHVAEGLQLKQARFAFGCEETGGNIWTGELGDAEDARKLPYLHPLDEADETFKPGGEGQSSSKVAGNKELRAYVALVELADGNGDCKLNSAELKQAMNHLDASLIQGMCVFSRTDCATGFTPSELMKLVGQAMQFISSQGNLESQLKSTLNAAILAHSLTLYTASYLHVASNFTGDICNASWFPTLSGKCVSAPQVVPQSVNVAVEAAAACAALGGGAHLPVLHSQSEVEEFLLASGLETLTWPRDFAISQLLGLSRTQLANQSAWRAQDGTGAEWGWADGSAVNSTFWSPGEPNNLAGNEGYGCLVVTPKGFTWLDKSAGACSNRFFCQTDAHRQAPKTSQIGLRQLRTLTLRELHRRSRCSTEMRQNTATTQRTPPKMCKVEVPKPKKAPSNCTAAFVAVELLVSGVDYAQLTQSASLVAAFKQKVQVTVASMASAASSASNSITPEHVSVRLSPGSVHVNAVITPPGGTSANAVQSGLASQVDMGDRIASALNGMAGIQSVMTGSTLVVSVVKVRALLHAPPAPAPSSAETASGSEPKPMWVAPLVLVAAIAPLFAPSP